MRPGELRGQASLSHNEEAHHVTGARVLAKRHRPHTESQDDRGYVHEPKEAEDFHQGPKCVRLLQADPCLDRSLPQLFGGRLLLYLVSSSSLPSTTSSRMFVSFSTSDLNSRWNIPHQVRLQEILRWSIRCWGMGWSEVVQRNKWRRHFGAPKETHFWPLNKPLLRLEWCISPISLLQSKASGYHGRCSLSMTCERPEGWMEEQNADRLCQTILVRLYELTTWILLMRWQNTKLGLVIEPSQVRLQPRAGDGYVWTMLPEKQYLFTKPLSKHSSFIGHNKAPIVI